MPQTSFCLTDYFEGNLKYWSAYNVELPPSNASDDDPAVATEGKTGDGASFEWESALWIIDLDIGGGPLTVTIPVGHYERFGMAVALQAALVVHHASFEVYWNHDQRAVIRNLALPNFSLLWATGANAGANNNAWAELGFDNSADDTGAPTCVAGERRYHTRSYQIFDLGTGRSISSVWLSLDGDDDTDYSSVRLFAHGGFLGQGAAAWEAGAAVSVAFSSRPLADESKIQIAHQSTAAPTTRRWYAMFWRHWDESPVHRIGLCKGFATTWDTTNGKTLQVLQGHRLSDPSTPIGPDHSRGVGRYLSWIVPLRFRLWPEVSYRDVFHKVVRHGRQRGLGWFLDFSGVVGGSITINLAVDKGEIVWAALQEQEDGDNFNGERSAFISGAVVLRQIR